ncbi:MAG: CNNM domain-containing protein [Bacteroidota bacterium]
MSLLLALITIIVLLFLSGLISASEMAFFSLSLHHKEELKRTESRRNKAIIKIIAKPKLLLATILIANNLVNVGIILISSLFVVRSYDFSINPIITFFLQVVVITFLILMIGEVIPKMFANRHALKVARIMVFPISFLEKFLYPISILLMASTFIIDKRIKKKMHTISVEDISHALELTSSAITTYPDHKILKGIVKFGQINVKQIMTPLKNITCYEYNSSYHKLLGDIISSGFSRIPVYKKKH